MDYEFADDAVFELLRVKECGVIEKRKAKSEKRKINSRIHWSLGE